MKKPSVGHLSLKNTYKTRQPLSIISKLLDAITRQGDDSVRSSLRCYVVMALGIGNHYNVVYVLKRPRASKGLGKRDCAYATILVAYK